MSEYLLCPKCFSNKLDSKSVMQTIPTIKCGDCGSVFDYQYVEEKCKTAPNNFIKKMGKAFANKCLKISQLEKENAELKGRLAHADSELGKSDETLEYYAGEGDHRTYLDIFDYIKVESESVISFDSDKFAERARQRIRERKELKELNGVRDE